MQILFIAPFPPPHTGNSLPVKELYSYLYSKQHILDVINLNKESHKSGITSLRRVFEIVRLIWKVYRVQKKYDIVYLTVAESLAGNFRDIIFYFIFKKRLSSVFIHMLGGANMNIILSNSHYFIFRLNKLFLKQLGGIIVEGDVQKQTFQRVIDQSKIHIVPNFAETYLFLNSEEITAKYNKQNPFRILFLSNMLSGKGHIELIKAFNLLDSSIQETIQIDFAGRLVADEEEFLQAANNSNNVVVHGSVEGDVKKKLFSDAHVFCLPTYYPFEGQPFSIIEAYAAGCFVITTDHSGIKEIFASGLNGYVVKKKNVDDLVSVLYRVIQNKNKISSIGLFNSNMAKTKYTAEVFCKKMEKVILGI